MKNKFFKTKNIKIKINAFNFLFFITNGTYIISTILFILHYFYNNKNNNKDINKNIKIILLFLYIF